jgi:UDP-3-O-[3-hydroxymyristoyl] glucosamine N-acyltransferase
MIKNPFFINNGPISFKIIFNLCGIEPTKKESKTKVFDVKSLDQCTNKDISFFNSIKYKEQASYTKAKICITTDKLKQYLPDLCRTIIVNNVLLNVAKVTKLFYPTSVTDNFSDSLKFLSNSSIKKMKLKVGKNTLVGRNVVIGKNTSIGHNTIIEDNVIVGANCSIGSNVILRNTIVKNNVHILDGCIIGKKGFGFFPNDKKNFRYPHIGFVFINDNCEIGAGCTFDRGSLSNTVIGKNTFFDNQVHIAHNVKIGDNCMIAGQVGIAGSSTIGSHVMIGGQAGISGHLKIGNNVQIGGGSGVIKNIPDNSKVMGYPATDFKNFLKEMRN